MFDNEIDWVTRLEIRLSAVRHAFGRKFPGAYTYKAEHKLRVEQDETQASVQVRRVSLGVLVSNARALGAMLKGGE